MALEITGKLINVQPVQQVNDTFKKREFVIEITEQSPSGMTFTNYASFQLVQDRVTAIDSFQPGDELKVSFNIRGNKWEKDGNVRYITNLNAWRIERADQTFQQQAPPPQQNQGFGQAPQAAPNTPPPAPPFGGGSNEESDLPF